MLWGRCPPLFPAATTLTSSPPPLVPSHPVLSPGGLGQPRRGGGGRSSVPRGGGTAPAPPALVRPTAEFAPLCPARSQRRPPGLYLKLRRPNKSSQASHRGLSLLGGVPSVLVSPPPPTPGSSCPQRPKLHPKAGITWDGGDAPGTGIPSLPWYGGGGGVLHGGLQFPGLNPIQGAGTAHPAPVSPEHRPGRLDEVSGWSGGREMGGQPLRWQRWCRG